MDIKINSIGRIESEYEEKKDLPRQSYLNRSNAKLIVKEEYVQGLQGLDIGDYIDIIFIFHKSSRATLKVMSRKRKEEVGVFASRSPNRPNNIGVSRVKIVGVKDNIITIEGVDMLNGTPVVDIKPSINY